MNKKELQRIIDKVPPNYYEQSNIFQKFWQKGKFNLIFPYIPTKNSKILDLGSADGFVISRIQKMYPENHYYAIDISGKLITAGKKKYPDINFKRASIEDIRYKNDYFDTVISCESLEHVFNLTKSLSEIKRVLKDKGTFIVEIDSGSHLFSLVWFFWTRFFKGRVWRGSHLQHFNTKTLEQLFVRNGFKIVDRRFANLGMAVIFKLKKKI